MKKQTPEPRYLLIIACSQRKRTDPGHLPAIERYDGVNFRVLQKAKREKYLPDNLDILILSAKYGLLEAKAPIENYGLKMTKQRAKELQKRISKGLDNYLSNKKYDEIFINLGKTYLLAIYFSERIKRLKEKTIYATGGIGQKASQMKNWLCQVQ